MEPKKPTIKGIFVNSHIKVLRDKKGEAGVAELERRFGRSVTFRNSEDVSVRDEVTIIEHVLDLLHDDAIDPAVREFEAGRLHFKDFVTTPLAKIIFSLYRVDFKKMMMSATHIAGHVFQGVAFTSEDLGPEEVMVTMNNNDYPIDHFKGLFQEWMEYSGKVGKVTATESPPGQYQYHMTWETSAGASSK